MSDIRIRVNAVLSVKDSFTGEIIKGNVLSVRNENGFRVIKKSEGYFVFVNCPEGEYRIVIESEFYQKKVVDITFGNDCVTVTAELLPNCRYNFDRDVIKLYGKLEIGKTVKAAVICENSGYRIMGECEKGAKTIRLFSSQNSESLPEQIMLTDLKRIYDIYSLTKTGFMEYMTDIPVKHDFSGEMTVCEVYDVTGDEKGEYFLALKNQCSKIVFIDGKKKIKQDITGNSLNYDFESEQ